MRVQPKSPHQKKSAEALREIEDFSLAAMFGILTTVFLGAMILKFLLFVASLCARLKA